MARNGASWDRRDCNASRGARGYPAGSMAESSEGPPQNSAAESRRLDSWKEIASFLGRGIRTVQRWEREEGLPVHRLPHAQRGSVFADSKELTAWWDSRQVTLARTADEPAPPARPRF